VIPQGRRCRFARGRACASGVQGQLGGMAYRGKRRTGGQRREKVAGRVVRGCLDALPEEIRAEAVKIPCLMRSWHPDVARGDEEARELLGEYLSYEEDRVSEVYGPIVLYLEAIEVFCEEEGLDFEDEVRATYLHELGHHFGWDEEDLISRGL